MSCQKERGWRQGPATTVYHLNINPCRVEIKIRTINIVTTRSREANAQDMCSLPAFLARRFVHDVEPRKLNVTKEKVNF